MRKFITLIATLALMCNGCAWLGFGDDESNSDTTVQAETIQEEAAPEPEVKAEPKSAPQKSSSSKKKGAKSEEQIKKELDAMGQKLVNQSARTLLPNKAHKEVAKKGSEWVATYFNVDTNNVRTELRPGANGQYVGFIRYQEEIMECRGATKEAALSAPCKKVGSRRLNELIRYDGNAWQD